MKKFYSKRRGGQELNMVVKTKFLVFTERYIISTGRTIFEFKLNDKMNITVDFVLNFNKIGISRKGFIGIWRS